MNRDNKPVRSGKGFSSRLLQVYFLPYAAEEEDERKSKRKPRDSHAHKYSYLFSNYNLQSSIIPRYRPYHPSGSYELTPSSNPSLPPCPTTEATYPSRQLATGHWAIKVGSHGHSSSSPVSNMPTTKTDIRMKTSPLPFSTQTYKRTLG